MIAAVVLLGALAAPAQANGTEASGIVSGDACPPDIAHELARLTAIEMAASRIEDAAPWRVTCVSPSEVHVFLEGGARRVLRTDDGYGAELPRMAVLLWAEHLHEQRLAREELAQLEEAETIGVSIEEGSQLTATAVSVPRPTRRTAEVTARPVPWHLEAGPCLLLGSDQARDSLSRGVGARMRAGERAFVALDFMYEESASQRPSGTVAGQSWSGAVMLGFWARDRWGSFSASLGARLAHLALIGHASPNASATGRVSGWRAGAAAHLARAFSLGRNFAFELGLEGRWFPTAVIGRVAHDEPVRVEGWQAVLDGAVYWKNSWM